MKKHISRILSLAMLLGMMTAGSLAADAYGPVSITVDPGRDYECTVQFDAAVRETRPVDFSLYYESEDGDSGQKDDTKTVDVITIKPGSAVTVKNTAGEDYSTIAFGYATVDGRYEDIMVLVFDVWSCTADQLFEQYIGTPGPLTMLKIHLSYDESTEEWTDVYLRLDDGAQAPAAPAAKTGEKLSAWAKELVDQAIDAKLMPGHLKGADLTQNITRTQFADLAVTLYEAMSGETVAVPSENPFTDTSDEAVLKAYSMGFTSGVSATEFGAGQPLTREAAATMLAAVYKKTGGVVSADGAAPFADDAAISAWAKDNVYFMAQHGVIAGVGDNTFDSKSMAQSQAALIMALRMSQNLTQNP